MAYQLGPLLRNMVARHLGLRPLFVDALQHELGFLHRTVDEVGLGHVGLVRLHGVESALLTRRIYPWIENRALLLAPIPYPVNWQEGWGIGAGETALFC
jgi:hypothetical protein